MLSDKVSLKEYFLAGGDDKISPLVIADWNTLPDKATRSDAISALEQGKILIFPNLPFILTDEEQTFLRPDCVEAGTKTIKFSVSQQRLWGIRRQEKNASVLKAMMWRYAESARSLVTRLFPDYSKHLATGNTSFRPVEAMGRVQSRRHDDRLLHVDAFPSRPTAGKRLLRVFTNVHPGIYPRTWITGEVFADVANYFLPRIPAPRFMASVMMHFMGITKSVRTPYDHYMLHLHDKMKLDDSYQAQVNHTTHVFAPGSSWIVFSDQVSHAIMSGQHALEQTFILPPEAQADPATSPLCVLERITGKRLR